MNKAPTPLRVILIIGASILLLLLVRALVKYALVGDSFLHWIDRIKSRP